MASSRGLPALLVALALGTLLPVSAGADVFPGKAWGWGVKDGVSHFETCTSSCQPGLAGGGPGQLGSPEGVAVDPSGNVYVADDANNRIDEFSSAGAFTKAYGWGVVNGAASFQTCTTSCQTGIGGSGAGQLSGPVGITTDTSGDVYVAGINRIDEFSSAGTFVKAYGWGVSDGMTKFETCTNPCQAGISGGGAGQFNQPFGIATDSSGDVYVADAFNDRIDEFSSSGSFVKAYGWGVSDGMSKFETCTNPCQVGLGGGGAGQFSVPEGVAVDPSGNLYVATDNNNRIDEFSSAGAFTKAYGWGVRDGTSQFETCATSCLAGLAGGGAGQLNIPVGVATDAVGDVYVADGNNRIAEFSPRGAFILAWAWGVSDGIGRFETCTTSCQAGLAGGGAGQLNIPVIVGVAIGKAGNAYVSDAENQRIDEFSFRHRLTVSKAGSGAGTVSSAPPGISCGSTCSHLFTGGVTVRLTATSAVGSAFIGWRGACSGTGACDVAMSADRGVSAIFRLLPPDTKITTATVDPKKHRATFAFKAIGRASGFQCELKRGSAKSSFSPCRSPRTFENLSVGHYTLLVRALNSSGADRTPARRTFTI